MKKLLILALGLFYSQCIFSQKMNFESVPRLYEKSTHLFEKADDTFLQNVKNIRYRPLRNKIAVREKTGKRFVSPDVVWGYKSKNELPIRMYKGDLYDLNGCVDDSLFVYSKADYKTIVFLQQLFYKNYFFSVGLDGNIVRLNKKNLKVRFGEEYYNKLMQNKYLRRRT